MWGIETRSGAARLLAVTVYVAAVLAFLLLQGVGLRLRRDEHRAWWAGTGRDLLNVAGLAAIAGAMHLLGVSWPAALLVGGTLTLLLFGASVLFVTVAMPHPRAWAVATGLVLALPVLVFTPEVVELFASAARALFPAVDVP